jgi:hypothetical protein
MSATEFPPCIDCGEPDSGTLPGGRCRDCDIEWLLDSAKCDHCGRHQWNDNAIAIGRMPYDHADDCPNRIERIAIVGSRDFKPANMIVEYVDTLRETRSVVVSGGARGVDTLAEQAAVRIGLPTIILRADWDKLGKRAGYVRNQALVAVAHRVVAFWDGVSRGTKHTIDIATKAGLPVDVRRA